MSLNECVSNECVSREPEVKRLMDRLSDATDMLSGAVVSIGSRLESVMGAENTKEPKGDIQTPITSPLGNQIQKQIDIIKERTATLNNYLSRLEV